MYAFSELNLSDTIFSNSWVDTFTLYPGNVNYTILLQRKYWLSANIHVSFETLLYLAEDLKFYFKNSAV